MDFNISHYSDQELIQLLGIDIVTEESIRMTISDQLSKYPDNQELQTFFNAIQERLLTEVKTRTINPEQKSTISRIIHIDSSHVPLHVENFSSDKFLFQLSDQINNVISLSLLSVEIPQSWYTFAFLKGNTRFVYYYTKESFLLYPYDPYGRTYFSTYDETTLTLSNPITNYTIDASNNILNDSGDIITTIYEILTDDDGVELYLTVPDDYANTTVLDDSGNLILLEDRTVYRVTTNQRTIDASGNYVQSFDEYGDIILNYDSSGNVLYEEYIIDSLNNILQLDVSGNYVAVTNEDGIAQNTGDLYSIRVPIRQPPVVYYVSSSSDKVPGLLYKEDDTPTEVNIFRSNTTEIHTPFEIPDGNYTIVSLLNQLKTLVNTVEDTFDYTIVKHSGKVIFTSRKIFKLSWHDATNTEPWLDLTYTNHNLGSYLGFVDNFTNSAELTTADEEYPYILADRQMSPEITIYHTFFSPNVLNVNGTRYIILELNDFSSNRISNNIVLMNALPRNKVVINDNFKQDLPQIRTGQKTTAILSSTTNVKNSKINVINNYTNLPPAGKQLIVRQASNLFAKIPLKRNAFLVYNQITQEDEIPELGYARHFSELTGSLQGNVREYLGPITLSNLEISLYDDKGFLLGLNGMNWSCSIVVKSIYQKKK